MVMGKTGAMHDDNFGDLFHKEFVAGSHSASLPATTLLEKSRVADPD